MNTVTILLLALVLVGAVVGFARRKIFATRSLRYFSAFLLFQFAYQFGAYLYSFVLTEHAPNYFIFNLALPINLAYFSWVFHEAVDNATKRRWIVIAALANLVFFAVNLAFIQGLSALMTYSRTIMAVTMVVYALLYFHEMLTSSAAVNEMNPTRNAAFWIVTAVFFFYLCSTLTIIAWDLLMFKSDIIGPVMVRVFSFQLYAMYIIGMLLHKTPNRGYSAAKH